MTRTNYAAKIPLKTTFEVLFLSQSLTNAISLPLNSNFPHPTQTKIKFPSPQALKIVKCPGFAGDVAGGGGGGVEVSI